MNKTYAIDFETDYSKDRDIKTLGVVPYIEHEDTQIYLVAIVGPGVSYSGPLETAPWALIDGHVWVSHNAAFDAAVYLEAVKRGQIPSDIAPSDWHCTANLCAFLAAPRSLGKACQQLLHVEVDKTTRDKMKGKTWASMSPEFQQECIAYALVDAERCLQIWTEYQAQWPAQEIALSRHTMDMCLRGIAVDLEAVMQNIELLNSALWVCQQRIPWFGTLDADGEEVTVLSSKALKAECAKRGIPPPLTTADKSEIFELWMEKHAHAADFVMAVKDYRSINRTLEVLKKLYAQTRADGRLRYSLLYGGAHTLRFSGSGGLNFHNLTKDPLCFDEYGDKMPKDTKPKDAAHVVDLRGCIIPGPGKKFIVADLSQIEARVALWFADDKAQLDLIKSGMDLYEAHARSKMGYKFARALKDYCSDPTTPAGDRNIRQFAKCRVLGLGFGLGFRKFVMIVMQWAGIVITTAQAKAIVDDFRKSNPGIVKMWKTLDRAIRNHAAKGDPGPFKIELPSWRSLSYFDVSGADETKAREEMGGPLLYWYGGKLFENLVQATARDILAEAILRIEAAGYPVVLHVHDEVICEVDLEVAPSVIHDLMCRTPDWAEGLPVGCEAHDCMRYVK